MLYEKITGTIRVEYYLPTNTFGRVLKFSMDLIGEFNGTSTIHGSIQCSSSRIRLTSFARSMTCLSLHPKE